MRQFVNMDEVIEWLKSHDYLYYQGPMDTKPYRVQVSSYTVSYKNPNRNSAILWSKQTLSFVANIANHFSRLRRPEIA